LEGWSPRGGARADDLFAPASALRTG
ncbi:cysteine methyltransferase, partial [Xanthomonas oryzae pv. oryzae]